ncbi:MAG: S8 family serine peptidase [Actinomycetota bacterium]|nr:S8 family serine peptidase [Actinomycetota bacterium]
MNFRWFTAFCAVLAAAALGSGAASAAGAAAASARASYVVVLKQGHTAAGVAAIRAAGGRVVRMSKIGVGTVTSTKRTFAKELRASGAVSGIARNARFRAPAATAVAPPEGTRTVTEEATACAQLYSVPEAIGPDQLSACQWDMRIIGASPSRSYAIDRGAGTRVGDLDTGIDLTHPDLTPNLDVASSCSFIYAFTPTSDPAEQVTPGDCSDKSAVQDLNGHGTHTAGIMAAAINGIGVAGVAPDATIVALKAGTIEGYFFTQSVVDGLVYAGDQRLDVVNMSFFADPWLFNCRNDAEQRAIVKAISRAARYAQQRGAVLVAAIGNEGIDLNHPVVDEISPDYPPGSETTRRVRNNCVVLPTELPGVVQVTATGAANLLSWFSTYGMMTDVAAPGGSRFQTPTFDPSRGRVLAPYSSTASDLELQAELGRLVWDPATGAYWAWLNGTSMAAPHVAGVVALIRANHPDMSVGAVVAALRGTATKMACPNELDPGVEFFEAPVQVCSGGRGHNSFFGAGLVNAEAAARR